MVFTHTYEVLALEASLDESLQPGGARVLVVELGPYDRSWNPTKPDSLLRGPSEVTYVWWPDGGIEAFVKALTT